MTRGYASRSEAKDISSGLLSRPVHFLVVPHDLNFPFGELSELAPPFAIRACWSIVVIEHFVLQF